MNSEARHSKLGIGSCFTAFGVWIYFVAALLLMFYTEWFPRLLSNALVPESRGMTDLRGMGAAVVVFAIVFFFLPVAGHFIGLSLGVIGALTRKRKFFAIAGILLNLLPAAVLTIFYIIGALASA